MAPLATNREVNNESDPSSPLQNLYSKLPKSIDLSICQSNATLSTKSSKRCLQVALDVFSARLSKDKWEKNLSLPVFSASLSLNGLQVQENMSNEICVLQRLTTFARTEICDDKLKLAVGGDISTIFFKYSASSIQYWHHLLPRREVKEIENSSQSDRIEIKTARSTALERIVQELLITVNITLADITFEFDFRTDTSKPSHCTRIVMGSLNTVAEVPEANRLKIDFGMENLLVETNKNSEILYGRLRKNNTFVLPQSRKHVWGRVISFANLQAQAFAHIHSGKLHSITISSQATAPCIEFSEAVEDFITMAKIYIPKSKSANNTRIKSDPNNRTNEKIIAEMNIKITDVNLFLCHYNKDINPIMLRIDDALFLNNSSEPLTFNISGIKCATISKKDKENNTFKREMANAIKMGFLDCPSVRVTKDLDNINIVLTEFIVDWDPTTHRCIADNITYAVSTIKQIKGLEKTLE
ncbi:uncharacterized protein TRIADDRAFT_51505 [Trichoplax adhaerens]|uniref:Uncharacterized protein n=1 Tax=Trichoplax adhaerens TaxID=10228 RepID=B3RJL1_TRIAD|nr:predicted protein [Trichoplax adhaerens]EDV29317.1 predicted protein [Trichoplax adhaerens]|eukprot:XP_002108519.1 predicted protein [Trichoplax adhaerens]